MGLEEFFILINLWNNQLIKIKKNIIQLLNELAENNIIQNAVEIVLNSNKKRPVHSKFNSFWYNSADKRSQIL